MPSFHSFLFHLCKTAVTLSEMWTYRRINSFIGKHSIREDWMSVKCLALHREKGTSFTIPDLTVAKVLHSLGVCWTFLWALPFRNTQIWTQQTSAMLKDFVLVSTWGHAVLFHRVMQHVNNGCMVLQIFISYWSYSFWILTPSDWEAAAMLCWPPGAGSEDSTYSACPWCNSTEVALWHWGRAQQHVHMTKMFSNCFSFFSECVPPLRIFSGLSAP